MLTTKGSLTQALISTRIRIKSKVEMILITEISSVGRIQNRAYNGAHLTRNGGLNCSHISIEVYLKHLSIITLNFNSQLVLPSQ